MPPRAWFDALSARGAILRRHDPQDTLGGAVAKPLFVDLATEPIVERCIPKKRRVRLQPIA